MKDLYNKIEESANYIKSKINISPSIGLILGSGLGVLADEIENPIKIKYDEIPNFPVSTVQGHAGQLVIGKLQGKNVIAMQGRFHYYEGYSMEMITFPVRVMKSLGVETIFVTNAAGGANRDFKPGDLMIITDHINLSGNNPLIGPNDNRIGTRFPDMSAAYTKEYIELARKCANKLMAKILGADAVGMSTAPEVIVASHSKLKVVGISCITNMAAGILDQPLDHEEVIETTQKVQNEFLSLVKMIVSEL